MAIDLLTKYIKQPRQPEPIKVLVAVAHDCRRSNACFQHCSSPNRTQRDEEFIEQEILVAIYGTDWDGTVILEADASGSIRAIAHGLTSEPVAAH